MIRIKATGSMGGDATYPYDVLMDREYTVAEFIAEACSVKENWGDVRVSESPSDLWGKSICEYRYGEIGEIPPEYADRKVMSAHGRGGWSCYDFTLSI